jgi:hypothetical protein
MKKICFKKLIQAHKKIFNKKIKNFKKINNNSTKKNFIKKINRKAIY